MKTPSLILNTGLVALFSLATAGAKDIKLADAPAAVQATIKANSRGGTVDDVEQIQIKGSTVYIADIDLKGDHDLTLRINPEGALMQTKEDLPLASAPEPVREALKKLGGRVDDIDKITVGEKVSYAVDLERRGQPDLNLLLDPAGKILSQTEDKDDD